MRVTGKIAGLILFILAWAVSAGQVKNAFPLKRCPVKTINFEQGLLNNTTTNIITDQSGFTWISSQTGLQRFNGYMLETIAPMVGKNIFTINYPVYFFGLKDGNIWISFKQGILEYNPASGTFRQAISLDFKGHSQFMILPLKETEEGIWCLQQGKGIVVYNRKGALLQQYSFFDPDVTDDIINSNDLLFRTIIAVNDHYIFIQDRSDHVTEINIGSKTARNIDFIGKNILGIACTKDQLYVISDKQLLFVPPEDIVAGKTISLSNINKENIVVSGVYATHDNHILVNLNSHLYEFDTSGTCQSEFTDLNRNPVVSAGFIDKVYMDPFKRIWLLTNNDIKRLQDIEIPFAHFLYPDLKNNFIRSLYYDEQKHVVVAGCLGGGIQLYDTLANPLWEKPLISADIKDVIGLEKLTDEEYLVITFKRGWFLVNLQKRLILPFNMSAAITTKLQSRLANFGNNIQRIDQSTIDISTADNVFRCTFSGDKLIAADPVFPFTNISSISPSHPAQINCFVYATDKSWWAGTLDGIVYKIDKAGKLQTIQIPENYLVRSITEDAKHNIWVGANKGLYIYSATGNLIKAITRETGLLNDCIYALLPAGQQPAVFASSNLGLSYVTTDAVIKNFTKETGLQENEFNSGSCLKTAGGRYYFGGVNGITAFYPSSLFHIVDTPILHITKLVINDSLFNSSAGIWNGDSIILNYRQNHLRIDLAALGLLNTNEYLYKYRLLGFENSWQTTYQPTGINYILEPGSYTLEINCSPILSSEDTFNKKIVILISPPWWKTWWFRVLAIASSLIIIFILVQQYNRRKFLQKIRLLQTEQDIQSERERISRDLHDNLGAYASAIISDADGLDNISQRDKPVLENLKLNAGEIMSNLRDTIWALNKGAITVYGLSDRFKGYIQKIQPAYADKKIIVSEDITHNHPLSPTLALNIFRIMQEAVHNAVKHSDADNINILVAGNQQQIKVTISDNGHGFQNAEKAGKGYGLQNMRDRAAEVNLNFSIEKNEPLGTKVLIYTNNLPDMSTIK